MDEFKLVVKFSIMMMGWIVALVIGLGTQNLREKEVRDLEQKLLEIKKGEVTQVEASLEAVKASKASEGEAINKLKRLEASVKEAARIGAPASLLEGWVFRGEAVYWDPQPVSQAKYWEAQERGFKEARHLIGESAFICGLGFLTRIVAPWTHQQLEAFREATKKKEKSFRELQAEFWSSDKGYEVLKEHYGLPKGGMPKGGFERPPTRKVN